MTLLLNQLPLVVLLAMAAGIDARTRRIPNWLTLLLLAGGIARSLLPGAPIGPGSAIAGMFVAAAIPLAQFAIGAMGAGDVKLMAGAGAWLGPWAGLAVFAIAAVVGLAIVVIQAAQQRRTTVLAQNSLAVAISLFHLKQTGVAHARRTGQACRSIDRPLPYAVPVFVAVLALILWVR